MNLYGERGNIEVIAKFLKNQNIKVSVTNLSLGEVEELENYDLIYIGCGTEKNMKLAIKDLISKKANIEKFLDNNKFFICTGNAMQIFGSYVEDLTGNKVNCLSLFDFYSIEKKKRIVDEFFAFYKHLKKPIIGYQNFGTLTLYTNNHLFEFKNTYYGFKYKNFWGIPILGPVFARNPHFTEHLIKKIIKNKYPKHKYKSINYKIMEKAYQNYCSLNFNNIER